jgi:glutathione S-transferase
MKLYTGDLSPYSAKIRMQIYAMGIEDEVAFDLPLAQFFSGRLKEFSPIGRIPILETDHAIIPESEVIAEYLDDTYPNKAMVGRDPIERANVRVISRIADIYLMNNIFMSLSQANKATRNQGVVDLLMGQVNRGMGALEAHIAEDGFAASDQLTRADCTLVPALFMCENTVPRLDVPSPIRSEGKVANYWRRIQDNECAARVLDEMARGLKARLDGTEQKQVAEAMARAKADLGR